MNFTLNFTPIIADAPFLLKGAGLTIGLSLFAIVLGTALAIVFVGISSLGNRFANFIIQAYVELLRNTPFLVQLFMIFFGLPLAGLRMTGPQAALLAMTLNLAAYATEIIRAGVDSIHKSQIEAGLSLAMSKRQVFQYVILLPAIAGVWPALSSQFVLMMLASSICSFISVQELSGAAAIIEQRSFRSFETYIIVTLAYLAMALSLKLLLNWLGRRLFGRRVRLTPVPATGVGAA